MNKALGMLGMAMRARKLNTGDAVIEDIRNKKARVVIIAKDASENTKKKITDKCHFYNVEYYFVESGDELTRAIGKHNCKAVSVVDEGFAKSLRKSLKG